MFKKKTREEWKVINVTVFTHRLIGKLVFDNEDCFDMRCVADISIKMVFANPELKAQLIKILGDPLLKEQLMKQLGST